MPLSDDEMAMLQVSPASLKEVLSDLIDIKREVASAGDDLQLPLVTLHLRSGMTAKGYLIDIHQAARDGQTALIWLQGEHGGSAFDTCYIDVTSIDAVIVHDRIQFERSKSVMLRGQPLSSLLLKRNVAALAGELSVAVGKPLEIEVVSDSFEDSDEVRGMILRTLKLTTRQLAVLTKDEFGKEAVLAAMSRIAVRKHEREALTIEDRALYIDPTRLEGASRESIRSRLNSLF